MCLKSQEYSVRKDLEYELVVFGGYVRGTMRANSDIDILLVTDVTRRLLRGGYARKLLRE